jgi:hypothetical protein
MGASQNSSRELSLYPKIKSDAPLFELGQDRLAIDKLSALKTGLGTAAKTRIGASKTMCEIDDEN